MAPLVKKTIQASYLLSLQQTSHPTLFGTKANQDRERIHQHTAVAWAWSWLDTGREG